MIAGWAILADYTVLARTDYGGMRHFTIILRRNHLPDPGTVAI
jgi:hypothetical protein